MSSERPPSPPAGAVDAEFTAFVRELRGRVDALPRSTPLPDEPLAKLRELDEHVERLERFVTAAADVGCRVQRLGAERLTDAILMVLRDLTNGPDRGIARSVYIQPQPGGAFNEQRAAELGAALAAAGITVGEQPDDETLFKVDAGVTGVRLAIAETGSLICTSGPGSARGASLIPPVHIAIVGASQSVPDLFDAFAQLAAADLPANINFITGPSKTADIEGVLVTGVHGPGSVHVLVVEGW